MGYSPRSSRRRSRTRSRSPEVDMFGRAIRKTAPAATVPPATAVASPVVQAAATETVVDADGDSKMTAVVDTPTAPSAPIAEGQVSVPTTTATTATTTASAAVVVDDTKTKAQDRDRDRDRGRGSSGSRHRRRSSRSRSPRRRSRRSRSRSRDRYRDDRRSSSYSDRRDRYHDRDRYYDDRDRYRDRDRDRRHSSSSSSSRSSRDSRDRRSGGGRSVVKKEKVIDEHTYTYLLTTKAAFNMEYFRKMCEESPLPFKEVTVDECRKNKKVGFVFSDNQIPKMRKMLHRVHSGTKNELTAAITNKAKLHDLLTVHVPEAIPETHTVTSKTQIVDGDLWIWRPAAGFKGQGVYVIKTQARMEELYKAHKEQPKTERLRHPEVIITRYIEQPLLYNKRKTTFRIFALATIIGEERHAYMFDRGFMRLAEQEYKLDDFDNMKIHDAHLNREAFNEEMFYPDHIEDLVDTKSTTEQMHSILAKVFTKALPQFIFYPESDNAFRIFGVDFMIDANGKVILIEINGRPGFNLIDPTDPKTMYKMLSEGVFHKAVHPCFGQPVKEDVELVTKLV